MNITPTNRANLFGLYYRGCVYCNYKRVQQEWGVVGFAIYELPTSWKVLLHEKMTPPIHSIAVNISEMLVILVSHMLVLIN